MTAPTRAPRRRLLVAVAVLVSLADAALLAFLAIRPAARPEGQGMQRTFEDPRSLAATDSMVAAAFRLLRRQGLAAALDALDKAAAGDSAVLRAGHQIAHALGRQALTESGGDGSVLAGCRADFGSGCYHGVVEALVQSAGRVDMAALERMCRSAGNTDHPGPVTECLHGLGHGVMGALGLDIESALDHCGELPTRDSRPWCEAGAFMEAISAAVADSGQGAGGRHGTAGSHSAHLSHTASPGRQLSIDWGDPFSPCDRYGGTTGSSCWIFQGFMILRRTRFDVEAALQVCDTAPPERAGECYQSIGHQITGLLQREDAWILSQCGKGRPDLAPRCAGGAALALDAMDWSGTRAARLCAAASSAWKATCYRSAGELLASLASPARRAALCAGVEPDYVALCREATGIEKSAGPAG